LLRGVLWFIADVSGHRILIFIDQDAQDAILTFKGRTDTLSRDVGNNPTPPSNPEVLRYPHCRFFSISRGLLNGYLLSKSFIYQLMHNRVALK
jgi:hypothetical protein